MLEVKVLGSGCANCQKLERETRHWTVPALPIN